MKMNTSKIKLVNSYKLGTIFIFTLVMFIGLSLLQAVPVEAAGTPIYVNADTGDDDYNGTTPETAVKTIAKGIELVDEGGTVYVAAGTYNIAEMGGPNYEPISINKPLTLKGDGSASTILDATGFTSGHCDVVWIRASNVTIEGFTVKNGSFGIRVNNPNSPISDLCFKDMIIESNTATGVVFDGATTVIDVKFENVKVIGNGTGGDGRGIYLAPQVTAANFTLKDTECSENKREGFHVQAILLNGLTITGGKFNYNTGTTNYYGSGITLERTTNAVINGIEAIGNGSVYPSHGVYIKKGSTNVEVKNSTISNSKYGILFNTSNADANNKATKNTISECEVGLADYNGKSNTHNYNNIANCSLVGIEIGEGASDFIDNIVLNFNSITGNTVGVDNKSSNLVDATHNWWGDASGPKHETTNPNGTGNAVSDNVLYYPWYTNASLTKLSNFITLTKTGPANAKQGDVITYTIKYKNEGNFPETNVVITETYPPEVEFVEASPAPDANINNKWTIGDLDPGEERTITVKVRIK